MGVPRDDLLLMARALKRGASDVRSIRKALDRLVSKPISLLEALHLPPAEAQALRADASIPDPVQDRLHLDALRAMLLEGEHLAAADWEKFVASLTRPTQRHGWPSLAIPQEFDGYALQWELARRERGVVYRAKGPDGRDVAIKVFRKEAAAAAGLPRVEGHGYAVSPFEDGEPIDLRRPSSIRRGAQVIEKAAQILRGRPHGALTPARIVVRRDDSVGVLGFEHAKAVPASPRTLAYGAGDDVRALGAILYELLAGSPPAGEVSSAARNRDVDEALDRIVACALTGGYAATGDLADDLARWLKGEPVTGRKASSAAAGRRRLPWGWIAAAAVPLAALAVWLAARRPDAPPPRPEPEAAKPAAAPTPSPGPERTKEPARPKLEAAKPAGPVKPLTPGEEDRLAEECLRAVGAKDYEKIIALSNEAVGRGSKRDWPYVHLASAYSERGELDKALEYATRAAELAPESREYPRMRAEILAFRGEARRALAALEALCGTKTAELNREIRKLDGPIEADPKDGRSRVLRGAFYCLKKNFERALDDFTAALDHGQPRARAWRALAFLGCDDRVRAGQEARAFLVEFPSDFASDEVRALLKELGQ